MGIPELQKPAPFFKGTAVVDGAFKEISLTDYKGKYLVLFFYPLDFTFVCPTEIIAFSDMADEFRKINCEVVAASCDSQYSHLAWINTSRKEGGLGEMKIPVLADKSMEIARAYGVLKEDLGIPFRGLFIIDANQNLRQITVNDLPVGRSVEETLRLVQAFQFTDKHGEVCPVNWKPGSKTMVPDPKKSKDYFHSQENGVILAKIMSKNLRENIELIDESLLCINGGNLYYGTLSVHMTRIVDMRYEQGTHAYARSIKYGL